MSSWHLRPETASRAPVSAPCGGAIDAAVGFLKRSLELTRPHRLDVHLEVDLALSYWELDQEAGAAVANAAVERASAAGDEASTLLAGTVAALFRARAGEAPLDEVERLATEARSLLEARADYRGLVTVWFALGELANWRGRQEDRAEAIEEAIRLARLGGEKSAQPNSFGWAVADSLAWALVGGPRPAGEALEALDKLLPNSEDPGIALIRAILLTMLDRRGEADPRRSKRGPAPGTRTSG
jgi:hypothetical protein